MSERRAGDGNGRAAGAGKSWRGLSQQPCMTRVVMAIVVCLGALAGCDRAPARQGVAAKAPEARASAAPAMPTPRLELASGWSYDPSDRIEGYEEFVTIRLGSRLRVYVLPQEWTPATLALLDEDDRVVSSIRLDLPPVGSISGPSLQIPDSVRTVRLTQVVDGRAGDSWVRRIGTPAPELSSEQVEEINAESERPGSDERPSQTITLSAHATGLDPVFGRIMINAGRLQNTDGVSRAAQSSASGVANHEFAKESPSDERWLTSFVKEQFAQLRAERLPQPAAGQPQH